MLCMTRSMKVIKRLWIENLFPDHPKIQRCPWTLIWKGIASRCISKMKTEWVSLSSTVMTKKSNHADHLNTSVDSSVVEMPIPGGAGNGTEFAGLFDAG
jgi:hypothetical protein